MTNALPPGAEVQAGELAQDAIAAAVEALLDPTVAEEAKADFLLALRRRGETPAEIAALAEAMLRHAVDPEIDPAALSGPCLDVCGTGGDGLEMFNVSTTVSFVVAAGGACVAKHGNRAITSKSGGADVLEALGVPVQQPPAAARAQLQRHGFAFFFAPDYHPAFRVIAPVRRALAARGEKTVFNLLGPLLNPARPQFQLAGIFAREHLRTAAEVMARLGRRSAWAIHGLAPDGRGMDEVSPLGPTHVWHANSGELNERILHPGDFGLAAATDLAPLRGGDAQANAELIRAILAGTLRGPARDIVLLNAAAAFVVCGLSESLPEGVARAAELIDRGAALERLGQLAA